ncbi:MAG: peroxidase [Acidobacteria bacterium]|nr:peroxidase [Acidobacteriota bacterium]
MPGPQLDDIQGLILRTYAMPALRVFVLSVRDAAGGRRFLGSLQLATATEWKVKPDYCVNLALTHPGLAALGVGEASLATFPDEFKEGAPARAARIGDTGTSAPDQWIGGLNGPDVHILLFLFAQSEEILTRVSGELRAGYSGAMAELSVHDARGLPGNVAHFGYRDGFAQPTIDGGLSPLIPDPLPKAPTGEFLLGYPSQFNDFQYSVPAPEALGHNGSFVAFRILSQDCHAFEEFLKRAGGEIGKDPEWIAAKLCGRWRNGVPLALAPEDANAPVALEMYNTFDYVPSDAAPDAVDDRKGLRCPIGSHIRRMNPRNSTVAGGSGLKRRIIRRGLPYGPPYDPANPNDGVDRGLLGIFIGASIKDQFEFLMADWGNKGTFAPGLGITRDPIIGDNSAPDAKFLIPMEGRKPAALSLSRFVTTRGGAYAFLPSATALRYLSTLP